MKHIMAWTTINRRKLGRGTGVGINEISIFLFDTIK
jgi:hypothetical protein